MNIVKVTAAVLLAAIVGFMGISSTSAHHMAQSDMAGWNISEDSPHLDMEF